MMEVQKEELLSSPAVFRAVVAPVVTISRSDAAPRAQGAPVCYPPSRALAALGGGDEANEKATNTGANCLD